MPTTSPSRPGGPADLSAQLVTLEAQIPEPLRAVLRGIGQVFFQDNALTGACFLLGILVTSPLMAVGALVGSALGYATARAAGWNAAEIHDGIYGFNATLVGIAAFFFFQPGVITVLLLLVGCVAATGLTYLMRTHVPFPTYTAPFVVTTWVLHAVGNALKLAPVTGYPTLLPDPPLPFTVEAISHGIGQVMFQGSLWAGLLFLIGIALNNGRHATLVLAGSMVGMLMAWHHTTAVTRSIDPERLVDRSTFDTIRLGLYGFNATLAPVALTLWRKSIIPALLGMWLTVPLAELVPRFGVPALTAPFVLATWIVLLVGWIETNSRDHTPS